MFLSAKNSDPFVNHVTAKTCNRTLTCSVIKCIPTFYINTKGSCKKWLISLFFNSDFCFHKILHPLITNKPTQLVPFFQLNIFFTKYILQDFSITWFTKWSLCFAAKNKGIFGIYHTGDLYCLHFAKLRFIILSIVFKNMIFWIEKLWLDIIKVTP